MQNLFLNQKKMDKLSSDAKSVITKGYGYRTDAQSEGIMLSKTDCILDREINELGNTDIPDTISEIYDIDIPDSGDEAVEAVDKFIRNKLKLNQKDEYQLIWLANSWKTCLEFYSDYEFEQIDMHLPNIDDLLEPKSVPEDFPLDKFKIGSDWLLISDCGVDGQLFATVDNVDDLETAIPLNY